MPFQDFPRRKGSHGVFFPILSLIFQQRSDMPQTLKRHPGKRTPTREAVEWQEVVPQSVKLVVYGIYM